MKKMMVKAAMTRLPVGERAVYRLVPSQVTKMTEGQFVILLSKISGYDQSKCRYWLDTFRMGLAQAMMENICVDLGFMLAKLYVGGSIESLGEQPTKEKNPVRGRVFFKGDVAKAFAEIEVVNDTITVNAIIYELQQEGVADRNRIESSTALVILNGNEIKIDPNQPDNGVWLEDIKTSVKVAEGEVVYSDSAALRCKFPTLPPTGQYCLVVGTRNGEDPEKYALARATRNVFVKNGEEVDHE